MWIRKRLDISWSDLAFAARTGLTVWNGQRLRGRIEDSWSPAGDALACLSVRTGFDLLLQALDLPRGSEILFSAITIPDMVRIAEQHGLVVVPVDLDGDALTISAASLQRAAGPHCRAVVVAHLFGARPPIDALVEFARARNLVLIEDCAQAFDGALFRGHPQADASLFSFGPIKTSTALGGAILRISSPDVRQRVRAIEAGYRLQTRRQFAARVFKYAALKLLSSRLLFGGVVAVCRWRGWDYDRLVRGSARAFGAVDLLARIRRRPAPPQLALLWRRLRKSSRQRIDCRVQRARLLSACLGPRVSCPTMAQTPHTCWVFPVRAPYPARLVRTLSDHGFDGAHQTSLEVVPAPADRPELGAAVARDVLEHLVVVPLYPELPLATIHRLAQVMRDELDPGPISPDPDIERPETEHGGSRPAVARFSLAARDGGTNLHVGRRRG